MGINIILNTSHKLNGIGLAVTDEWIGTLLLAGLPDYYKPMIMAIESSGVSISADAIKAKILQKVKQGQTIESEIIEKYKVFQLQ